jgi:hypothetical protein
MRVEEIADSGHHIFLTHTRRCLQLVESFVQEEDGQPAPA